MCSTLDDPGLLSAITPLSYFFSEHRHHGVRWSLCAREMCYRNPLLAAFFQSGKTLPVDRGAGLDQLSMRGVGRAVGRGDWLHIFPEGRVVYTGTLGALRWGVGRVVCDAVVASGGRAPVVLPFYHSGMARVMPYRARLPQVGQRVHVLVGEPVQIEDVACNCNRAGVNQEEVREGPVLSASLARAALTDLIVLLTPSKYPGLEGADGADRARAPGPGGTGAAERGAARRGEEARRKVPKAHARGLAAAGVRRGMRIMHWRMLRVSSFSRQWRCRGLPVQIPPAYLLPRMRSLSEK